MLNEKLGVPDPCFFSIEPELFNNRLHERADLFFLMPFSAKSPVMPVQPVNDLSIVGNI